MTRGGFKYCFLFCCLLALAVKARILRTPCISQAKFSYKRNNTRLVGAIIAKYNNKERVECESACLLEPRCKSVNTKKSECELHSKTISDFTDNCTESNSTIANDGSCTLIKDTGWTFESTNYSNPLLGFNCNRNNPCGKEYLCMDTCVCPGYECLHCSKVHNFPCPDIDDCVGVDCNRGTCEDLLNGYKCNCPPPYIGKHCETALIRCSHTSVHCQNGASCVDKETGFHCECTSQFSGIYCENSN